MKQKKLIHRVYQACIEHDKQTLHELQQHEFEKIVRHKQAHKPFDAKWTVVRL